MGIPSAEVKSRADLARLDPELCVVKLGSAVVTTDVGRLDQGVLDDVARFVGARLDRGRATLIVSSGAVACGIGEMGLEKRPKGLPDRQALAALGQSRLMASWADAFARQDRHVAQVLLSAEDFHDRRRYLNMRYTLDRLMDWGAVPIINENDTVAVDELRLGDNDDLAVLLALKMMAHLLVFLTSAGGLYRCPPAEGEEGALVDLVERVTPEVEALASSEKTAYGAGGMASKLRAARQAAEAGIPVVIAPGKERGALERILSGGEGGTLLLPAGPPRLSRRQRYIAFSRVRPRGRVWIDAGAVRALTSGKKSLLPAGVRRTEGDYVRHDVIEVLDPSGRVVARGLTNYNSQEVARIQGRRTSDIEPLLGARDYDEIIHRDNLVVIHGDEIQPGAKR